MARYKPIDTNPRLLPVNLAAQLLPGTFEHAVDHLLEHAIDLSGFDARFRNDATGAPAYPPAVLLKVVLCAYARGIVSSRAIARLCEDHVTFIALCGARTPHFTTIAAFVSTLGPDIARVSAAVLAVCDQQGLIGREMFAIDGVKLPSNASRRSGKRADFERQAEKLEAAAATMLARHRAVDATDDAPPDPPGGPSSPRRTREAERLARLEHDAAQLRTWVVTHPDDRRSAKGAVRLSNRSEADSAKMATGKGVGQGYTAVAAVDARAQIIMDAQAHGTGTEHELLLPVVAALAPQCTAATLITADAGYHSEANLRALAAQGRHALIGDNGMRARDYVPCPHRSRCLRTPGTTQTRQMMFFEGYAPHLPETYTRQIQRRLDVPEGRAQYGRRFTAVEFVFANLKHNKGLARFTLRGRAKVDGQWKLLSLVHNFETLAHAGYAAWSAEEGGTAQRLTPV